MGRVGRPSALGAAVRHALAEAADPARAPAMQAYMKSTMPFQGVGAPERRAIVRELLAAHPFASGKALRDDVHDLFAKARYREERYVAVDLLLAPRCRKLLDLDVLPLFEEIIVTGAWWDYVDAVASHGLGTLLRRHPREMKQTLRAWSGDENLWKRRAAILAQLRFESDLDVDLLHACIEPNLDDREFFIQKAIGWALRQQAWTDPRAVQSYVKSLGPRLGPLAKREALKNLVKKRPK